MKTFSKSHFEILFLKKLLNSEGFLGKGTPKRASEMNGFLLGFRKGSVVFDLEKSLTMYFKALRLIKACRESSYSILFVGCPPLMELSLQKELHNSPHTFVSESSWVLGSLTNSAQSEVSPSLIVTFNLLCKFPSKECFKKEIPLISFVDETCDLSFIDYPIFVNLKSEGAAYMYQYLIKQSILNSNGEQTL